MSFVDMHSCRSSLLVMLNPYCDDLFRKYKIAFAFSMISQHLWIHRCKTGYFIHHRLIVHHCHDVSAIHSLPNVDYRDLKPVVNSYIEHLVQIKLDVAVHCRDLYLSKPTLGPPTTFKYLTRGGCNHPSSNWPCQGQPSRIFCPVDPRQPVTCGQTLTIDHMLLECVVSQKYVRNTTQLYNTPIESYLNKCNLWLSTSPQMWTLLMGLTNLLIYWDTYEWHLLGRAAKMWICPNDMCRC